MEKSKVVADNPLLSACFDVWRLGYKREKALQHIADNLGYKPLVTEYVPAFRKMLDNQLGKQLCGKN